MRRSAPSLVSRGAPLVLSFLLAACAVARPQTPVAPAGDRSAALSALFKEIWEDDLKHSPEFASSIGDKRYNDQLSDLSPRAVNDRLARRREFLARLAAIDTTGLSEQEKLSSELLERELIEGEEGARFKEWQMPVNQFHGIHTDLPAMVVNLALRYREGLTTTTSPGCTRCPRSSARRPKT